MSLKTWKEINLKRLEKNAFLSFETRIYSMKNRKDIINKIPNGRMKGLFLNQAEPTFFLNQRNDDQMKIDI